MGNSDAPGCRRRPSPKASDMTAETPQADPDARGQLHRLFDSEWERTLRESPILASELGEKRFDAAWPDLGLDAFARRHRDDRRVLERLDAIDPEALPPDDRLNLRLFRRKYEVAVEEYPFRWWLLPLTAREGIQDASALADALTFESAQDHENWL